MITIEKKKRKRKETIVNPLSSWNLNLFKSLKTIVNPLSSWNLNLFKVFQTNFKVNNDFLGMTVNKLPFIDDTKTRRTLIRGIRIAYVNEPEENEQYRKHCNFLHDTV